MVKTYITEERMESWPTNITEVTRKIFNTRIYSLFCDGPYIVRQSYKQLVKCWPNIMDITLSVLRPEVLTQSNVVRQRRQGSHQSVTWGHTEAGVVWLWCVLHPTKCVHILLECTATNLTTVFTFY